MTDGAKAIHSVDIYARSGIIIKTKCSYLTDRSLREFISGTVDSLLRREQVMPSAFKVEPVASVHTIMA